MEFIAQAEMDNLATMANGVLLPIVNVNMANIVLGGFPEWFGVNQFYDKYAGGLGISGVSPVSPQPSYSFTRKIYANLIPANAHYDASGNLSLTIASSYDYLFQMGSNDIKLHDPTTTVSSGGYDYVFSTNNFYLAAGTTIVLSGTPNALVTAILTQSPNNWLFEMNRIRGDLMGLVFASAFSGSPLTGGEKLYRSTDAICSGPWIVGLIDTVAYPKGNEIASPAGEYTLSGMLLADAVIGIPIFNSVNFIFKESDLPMDFSGNCGAFIPPNRIFANGVGGGPPLTATFSYTANHAGTWNYRIYVKFTGSLPRPAASAFTKAMTPDFGWTWETITDSSGTFWLIGSLLGYALAASTGMISMSVNPPSGYDLETSSNTGGPTFFIYWLFSDFIYSTANTVTNTNAITTTSTGNNLSIPDVPADSVFTIGTSGFSGDVTFTSQFRFQVTPVINGVFKAKSFPVPGINVYLDQDMPPYIGGTALNPEGTTIAIAGNEQMDGTTDAPFASTMRQAAPIEIGSPDKTLINGVQSLKPGITARPAKWLNRRSTDFVPFDFGFNANLSYSTYSNNIAHADGTLNQYSAIVPPDATKIIIRLVAVGTVLGWKNGTFQYGDALPTNLTIYIKQSGPPTPSVYDFLTTNNAVTIPTDGGAGYLTGLLNSSFSFAVQNMSGTDVAYDAYVEIDRGTPKRVYFPPVAECFSYCLSGDAGAFFAYLANGYPNIDSKPIPQNGYCIFQIRATRLPTLNAAGISIIPQSGSGLTVKVGQNIFNDDGTITFTPFKQDDGVTDLTITIPATAGTSDDVKVFIPVLSGNEIVYQCTQRISFEAWANWQPVFFNRMYGLGKFPFDVNQTNSLSVTTTFQYALGFGNAFDVTKVGWVSPYLNAININATSSVVVFPLFKELYNDNVALLTILGGTLPGGQHAAGAGGSGSAGGAGSAGDIAAGGGDTDGL